MTLMPELRDEIAATAQRRARASRRPRRPSPWRRVGGGLTLAASVLLVAAVVAVSLLDVHHSATSLGPAHGLGPVPGTATVPPPGWGPLSVTALQRVGRRDAACRPRRLTGPAALRHDAPPRTLAGQLAVLRQPAPAGQAVSAKELRQTSQGRLAQFAHGIYLRYVRHGRRHGVSYDLVPAADVNQVRAVPGRCYGEQLVAFRALVTRRPAQRRAALIRYETTYLRGARAIAEHPLGLCLTTAGPGGSGAGPCVNAISVADFGGRDGGGSYGNNQFTVTARIVPDAVATVTAHYPAQTSPGRVPRPLTVTEHAAQNLVLFALRGAWDPPTSLIYRSATGAVLWSVTRP